MKLKILDYEWFEGEEGTKLTSYINGLFDAGFPVMQSLSTFQDIQNIIQFEYDSMIYTINFLYETKTQDEGLFKQYGTLYQIFIIPVSNEMVHHGYHLYFKLGDEEKMKKYHIKYDLVKSIVDNFNKENKDVFYDSNLEINYYFALKWLIITQLNILRKEKITHVPEWNQHYTLSEKYRNGRKYESLYDEEFKETKFSV